MIPGFTYTDDIVIPAESMDNIVEKFEGLEGWLAGYRLRVGDTKTTALITGAGHNVQWSTGPVLFAIGCWSDLHHPVLWLSSLVSRNVHRMADCFVRYLQPLFVRCAGTETWQ